METTNKKQGFWLKYQEKIIEELIKSIFLIIIAIITVYVWEKSKMDYGISFSKKIDIFSNERQILLENSGRFNENFQDLNQYFYDNSNSDFKSHYTYKSNVVKIKRILLNTQLILINSMIENDSLQIFQKAIVEEGQIFTSDLEVGIVNNSRYAHISDLFDDITQLYGKEITKKLK
jgi:hypothetical protein